MYTLLVNDDNQIVTTKKEVIMQRSNNVNSLQILVSRYYNDIDLSAYTVLMEYKLPVSYKYRSIILTPNNINYDDKNYIEYIIPVTTALTQNAGDINFQLTWIDVSLTADNGNIQNVRKTKDGTIHIVAIAEWSDVIPDEILTPLDQRVIAMQATLKQLTLLQENTFANMPADIKFSAQDDSLHLTSTIGEKVGNGVNTNDLADYVGTKLTGTDPDGIQDGVVDIDDIPLPTNKNVTNLDDLLK